MLESLITALVKIIDDPVLIVLSFVIVALFYQLRQKEQTIGNLTKEIHESNKTLEKLLLLVELGLKKQL